MITAKQAIWKERGISDVVVVISRALNKVGRIREIRFTLARHEVHMFEAKGASPSWHSSETCEWMRLGLASIHNPCDPRPSHVENRWPAGKFSTEAVEPTCRRTAAGELTPRMGQMVLAKVEKNMRFETEPTGDSSPILILQL